MITLKEKSIYTKIALDIRCLKPSVGLCAVDVTYLAKSEDTD